VPILVQDGMFMDGELYTCVSHNLSLGIGTFWFPQFSYNNMAGLTSFHEQPPLIFGIQSLFFKLLGNSMYVERFYIFLTTGITALLIVVFWRMIFKNDFKLKQLTWLPIIIWITIPVVFWSYSNNMHENTMGIFTLCAAIFIFNALESYQYGIITWFLGGVFVFLATLSKGLPGFFPIVIPILYWVIIKRTDFKRIAYGTAILIVVSFFIYGILFCFPASRESLILYFFKRALSRINELPTVSNRFYTLYSLVSELLPQIIILAIILFIGFRKKINNTKFFHPAIFFIAVGFAGTLPLMLTLVQKGFYYVPALPFFAIGFSILMAPAISYFVEIINIKTGVYKLFLTICSIMLIIALFFSYNNIGKTSRDKETLHDVYAIGKVVPKFSVISIPAGLWNDWSLQCYLMRYSNISLDVSGNQYDFYLKEKATHNDTLPGYKKVDVATDKFELFVKK
jgi:4-amino-4-deoxy-L-arabinose transferase-like glycosyltransferase